MATDHSARIAVIREQLGEALSGVVTDGTSANYDLAVLRQELRDLMAEDSTARHRKPRVSSFNLGNA